MPIPKPPRQNLTKRLLSHVSARPSHTKIKRPGVQFTHMMSERAPSPVRAVPRRDVCMGRKPTLKRGGSSSIHRVHRHRPHPPPQRRPTHPKAAARAHTSVELVRTTPEIAVGAASRPSILSEARSNGAIGPWRAGAPTS